MPLVSPHAKELARCLAEDLNSLRMLDRKDRDESNELIDRIRNFIRSFRPDLFQPAQTTTTEPERESK